MKGDNRMIEIGRFYYASTPRSKKQGVMERVKVLGITEDTVKCITVNPIKKEETYDINISEIRSN